MDEVIISDSSLERCLESASKQLNIPQSDIDYEIIKEKKGFFKKEITISAKPNNNVIKENQDNEDNVKNIHDGKVKICNGIISVTNPDDMGKAAVIYGSRLLKITVDGTEIKERCSVNESSNIEITFENKEPSRNIKIDISSDKMKAYISINYIPDNVYKLKDVEEKNIVYLEPEISEQKYPPLYTYEELKQELAKAGIVYGIIEDTIKKIDSNKENVRNVLIAQGKNQVDDENDSLELKIETESKLSNLKEDEQGKVDFKSIGFVKSVSNGEIIAAFHKGKEGTDGTNLNGKVVKKKAGKVIKLRIGQGCILKPDNTIIATIDGKPCIQNNTISVYSVHEINGNVNLSTGNIIFIGDINISGSVEEGMKVEAGNSVQIDKNVEMAQVSAKGNITIKQNAIESNIIAGGEDVTSLSLINNLTLIMNSINTMYNTVYEIKEHNLLGEKSSDGEIIKVLLENKFKVIPKTFFMILKDLDLNDNRQAELVNIIRTKLLGLGPLNIKHFSELQNIIDIIKNNIQIFKDSLALPVNVTLAYCQDCEILSSGNIIFEGKGDYVSKLTANDSILFNDPSSITRGGIVKAKNEIRCKNVGSSGGVITKLIVDEGGHIWADRAFQNTCFIVGERQYNLDKPSKEIHAYIDEKDELIVDKLTL